MIFPLQNTELKMAVSIVYSFQLRYNLPSINTSVMRLLYIINLSDVNAYIHLTNKVLSHSLYVVRCLL